MRTGKVVKKERIDQAERGHEGVKKKEKEKRRGERTDERIAMETKPVVKGKYEGKENT